MEHISNVTSRDAPRGRKAVVCEWGDAMKIGELLDRLGGNLANGDREWIVESVNTCEKASAFDLAFADSASLASEALSGHAGAVVLQPGAASEYPPGKVVIETEQPRLWFARAARLLTTPLTASGIHHSAVVAYDSQIAPGVVIGA